MTQKQARGGLRRVSPGARGADPQAELARHPAGGQAGRRCAVCGTGPGTSASLKGLAPPPPTYLRIPTARPRTAAAAAAAASGPRARAPGPLWPPPSPGVGGPTWAAGLGHIPAGVPQPPAAPSSRGLRRRPAPTVRAARGAHGGPAPREAVPWPRPTRVPPQPSRQRDLQSPGTRRREPDRASRAPTSEGTGAGRTSLRGGERGRRREEGFCCSGLTIPPLNVNCRSSVPEE